MEVFSIRVPREIKREIEELAKLEGREKSIILREILINGVKERKIKAVLKLYSEGKITLWKAARLAGISLWEIIVELQKHNITLQYGLPELEEDLKAALGENSSS